MCAADIILCPKTEHGIRQADMLYSQPENSIDVLFLGSSHIHYDVNTALLWDEYGIAAYDYSAAEQPLWITYHYLVEACKYQNPKVVVLDLYCPARFKEDYQYDFLETNLNGMRLSLNKLRMLLASCEIERIFEYFPDFVTYHSRYSELKISDFEYLVRTAKEQNSFKGFTAYFGITPMEKPVFDQPYSGGLTVKSEIYLQRIIDYCKDNDIELFLMVAPYMTTKEDETVYNRVHEIANYCGLEFQSTNFFYKEMEIDFEHDFNDESHLNYWGSCKFSRFLGQEIKDRFDIPDRRGDVYWESWDRHSREIRAEVEAATGGA